MAIYEDIARSIVRKRKEELSRLPEAERKAVVSNIISKLQSKSDDELITFFSAKEPGVAPELQQEIAIKQETLRGQELQAGVPTRQDGDQKLFTEQRETLPIHLQTSRLNLRKPQHEAELQSIGVATDKPFPADDAKVGFGVDKIESVKGVLSEHFNKPVSVFSRGQDILYVNPQSKEVELYNPGSMAQVGTALPLTGDVVGTVAGGAAGAAFTKSPAGVVAAESVGSGLGTGTGEFIRLLVGKGFGVHDLSVDEMMEESAKQGGKAAAATGVTGGLLAAGKGVRNFLAGGIFTKPEALKHGLSTKQADIVFNEVNKILKGKAKVKGTLFSKTDDVIVGGQEAEVRRNIKHAADFIERDLADQKAATAALDTVTGEATKKGGIAVVDSLSHQVSKRVGQAKSVVSKNITRFKSQLDEIGRIRKEVVGDPTRDVIVKKSQATQDAVDEAWNGVKELGGFNAKTKAYGIKIPIGKETKQLRSIMDRRSGSAVTKVSPASKVFVKGKGSAPDLADYSREISDLKSEIRAARKNKQFGTPAIADMDSTVKAMEADRRTALIKSGRVDLLDKIEKAEAATANFHKTYNRSIIGDLTKKNENGVFEIQGQEFVDKMLKGSADEADQLLRVIGDQPTLMGAWKEGIADAYKRKAFRKGVFNKDASEEFIQKHQPVLSRFFEPSDLAKFKKTGKLSETVVKQVNQMKRIVRNAETRWGKGKLKSLDPDKIVDFITNNSGSFVTPSGRGIQTSLSKIKYVKGVTRKNPEIWRSVQSEYRGSIRKRLVDPETGSINHKELSNFISKNNDEITEILGDQYIKDLRSINTVTQILARKPKILSGDETKQGIIQAIRSGFAPPLTRRGRAFTAAVIFDNKRAHDVMAKALLDPSTMKDVAKLAEHKKLNREVIELAVSLGVIELGVE